MSKLRKHKRSNGNKGTLQNKTAVCVHLRTNHKTYNEAVASLVLNSSIWGPYSVAVLQKAGYITVCRLETG